MLRTAFLIGLALVVGGAVLGIFFGIAIALLGVAIKIALVGAVAYFVIRLVSPSTAANLRARVEQQRFGRY